MATVLAVILTTNERLAFFPGNVVLSTRDTGLKQASVANVSQIITADRTFLRKRVGRIRPEAMVRVEAGLRLVLGLT
jgi:mRNA-degrading endonuclease toxin of MazEF toxin-antitoxin module